MNWLQTIVWNWVCGGGESSRASAALATVLSNEEIHRELGGLNPNHPAWRALRQLLRQQCMMELDMLLAPNLTAESIQRNAGRVSALMELESCLDALWEKTHGEV